jgi:hypothetical protein
MLQKNKINDQMCNFAKNLFNLNLTITNLFLKKYYHKFILIKILLICYTFQFQLNVFKFNFSTNTVSSRLVNVRT